MALSKDTVKELFFKKDEKFVSILDGNEYREDINTLRKRKLRKYIENSLNDIETSFKKLCNEFYERFDNNEWVLMRDDYCYISDKVALIPDLKKFDTYYSQPCSDVFSIHNAELGFGDFDGDIPTKEEAEEFLSDKNPYKNFGNGKIECNTKEFYGVTCLDGGEYSFWYTFDKINECVKYPYDDKVEILTVPIFRFNGIDSQKIPASFVLLCWLSNNLEPKRFKNDSTKKIYDMLRKIYKMNPNWLKSDDNSIVFSDKNEILEYCYQSCISGNEEEFVQEFFSNAKEILNSNEFEADDLFLDFFEDRLLNCDSIRANLNSYLRTQLYGINNVGHWDLFDYIKPEDSSNYFAVDNDKIGKISKYFKVKLPEDKYMTAIAPDFEYKNYVAIDFGTKSTVVAFEYEDDEGRHIMPIKVAGDSLSSNMNQYENPSIIEFRDFYSFLDDYNAKEYRPNTKWQDMQVAHSALNNLETNNCIDSVMTDIKSWCAKEIKDKIIKDTIKDEKGKRIDILPFSKLYDKDYNPLEYYAYFLGLYINKMISGKEGEVYTKYKMSFPVTMPKDIKDKIRISFARGIRKSFPKILLSDENFREQIDKEFIEEGLSEPAAYAITALGRFYFGKRLDKEKVDKLYYSVFDFGGGTTDFDFGYYSNLKTRNRKFNYELNHFGIGNRYGIPHLGGEKLLRYLVFELCKHNKDELKKQSVQFTTYEGVSNTDIRPLQDGNFISDDIYASGNMLELMKKLRWVWENPDVENPKDIDGADISTNQLKLQLRDKYGNSKEVTLQIPQNDEDGNQQEPKDFFKKLLSRKIEEGIKKFFRNLKEAFRKSGEDLTKIDEISIFLAGNSTKSILFNNLLLEYINDKKTIENGQNVGQYLENEKLNFVLYPPLGTEESNKRLKELKEKFAPDEDGYLGIEPTCKTGVAYGLLEKKIKVNEPRIKDSTTFEDVKFKYYVGLDWKGIFEEVIIESGSEIDMEWKELYKEDEISEGTDDLYPFLFSLNPEAGSKKMHSNKAKEREIKVSKEQAQEGVKIFIRAVKPNVIEWRVARSVSKSDVENPDNFIILD